MEKKERTTKESENRFPLILLIPLSMILVGVVLIISCFYNGFWTHEYAKATFHGLIGFVLINAAISMAEG